MLRKYRYIGEAEALIPDLHRLVQPGEVFEADAELNNPNLELVADEPSPAAAVPKRGKGDQG